MYDLFFFPMSEHKDKGLYVTAKSFIEAADVVFNTSFANEAFPRPLPTCYLYRHAIELSLKSMIVVSQLHFSTAYEVKKEILQLKDGNGLRPITNTHSIQVLFKNLVEMLKNHNYPESARIPECLECLTNIENDIIDLDNIDLSSTYFRYPETKDSSNDAAKSTFQVVSESDAYKALNDDIPSFLIINNSDQDSYYLKKTQSLELLLDKLKSTAKAISEIALAFYCTELN